MNGNGVKSTMKLFILTVFILIFISCGISKRREAETKIIEFEQQNVPDKREVIFDAHATFENGRLTITGETSNENLKNKLYSILKEFQFKDNLKVLPDSTVGEKKWGLINLSVANHRSMPDHSAELVTQSVLGTPVKILKKQDGWYLVQTPDNYISWIDSGGIQPFTANELEDWKNSDRLIFTGDFGLIYKSENHEQPVSDVVLGNIVELTERFRTRINSKITRWPARLYFSGEMD